MGGIHLPALQGIAGLKPVIKSGYQTLTSTVQTSIIIDTIPSNKIGLLTDVALMSLNYDLSDAYIAVWIPGLRIQYYIDGKPTLSAKTGLHVNSLIALPPGGEVRVVVTPTATYTLLVYGCSYMLFDYFGEE